MEQTSKMPLQSKTRRLECCLAEERRRRDFSEIELEAQVKKVASLEDRLAAVQDWSSRLEHYLANERILREYSETALQAEVTKVLQLERQRDIALDTLQMKIREIDSIRKYGGDGGRKRDRASRPIVAKREDLSDIGAFELPLAGRKSSFLRGKLDDARTVKTAGKSEGDTELPVSVEEEMSVEDKLVLAEVVRDARLLSLPRHKAQAMNCDTDLAIAVREKENVENKLMSVEGERDAALLELDKQKAEVIKCDTDLANILIEKRNLERKLSLVEDEKALMLRDCNDKLKMLEQAHTEELQMTSTRLVETERTLESLREEKSRLDAAHKAIQRNLEEEIDKRLCQICMESPKNTICFPCMHLNYCFQCLEQHINRTNTCPSCRTTIGGKLQLNICT